MYVAACAKAGTVVWKTTGVGCPTWTKDQRVQAYSGSFKDMTGSLTQGVASYRMLVLRCGCYVSCLNNRILNFGCSDSMLQVLMRQLLCLLFVSW